MFFLCREDDFVVYPGLVLNLGDKKFKNLVLGREVPVSIDWYNKFIEPFTCYINYFWHFLLLDLCIPKYIFLFYIYHTFQSHFYI